MSQLKVLARKFPLSISSYDELIWKDKWTKVKVSKFIAKLIIKFLDWRRE